MGEQHAKRKRTKHRHGKHKHAKHKHKEVSTTRIGPASLARDRTGGVQVVRDDGPTSTRNRTHKRRANPASKRRRRRPKTHADTDAKKKVVVVVDSSDNTAAENAAAAATAIVTNTAEREVSGNDFKDRKLLKAEENRASTSEVERISRRGPSRRKKHKSAKAKSKNRNTKTGKYSTTGVSEVLSI